jgi:hypothetical protein
MERTWPWVLSQEAWERAVDAIAATHRLHGGAKIVERHDVVRQGAKVDFQAPHR